MKDIVKSSFVLFLLISLSSTMLLGQRGFNAVKMEKMQAKKIAFITNKLDLSPAEAEKFWPIYNTENKKIRSCFSDIRKTLTDIKENQLSDEDAIKKANELIEIEEEILTHKRNLIKQLEGVISGNKILLLMRSERDFKRSMMHGMKKKRKNRIEQ